MKDIKIVFKCAVAASTMILMAALVSGCGGKDGSGQKETAFQNQDTEAVLETVSTEADAEKPETESVKEETEDKTEEAFIVYNEEEEDEIAEVYVEEDGLTPTQRNSINMLNYMSVLTQKVNASSGNELLLEETYSALVNGIYPNAVDSKTEARITRLMDTIEKYRMISVKRDRLEYIYEQNRAQALRQAIPDPVGLLSAVQSGSILKAAASVLYMAVDSVSSYQAATSQADLQYLQEGWELEDQESEELHNSTKDELTYMLNMVRDYDFDGDYALSEEAIEDFVKWSNKPESQLISKIEWFISHEDTYQWFGPYWLELVKDYYNSGDYKECLESIKHYEDVSTRIYRKDTDKASVLPMVILSAKEVLDESGYVETASRYCNEIQEHTKDADWSLRYFAAQVYMDLYTITKDEAYLESAYEIAFDNVNNMADEQRALNVSYMSEIQEVKTEKGDTDKKKKEAKAYNKLIKEERKVALPPVNEGLYLNADLLFALSEKLDIPEEKRSRIESILHESGENIFLSDPLDNRFWFSGQKHEIHEEEIEATYDGDEFTIQASYVSDRSVLEVDVSGEDTAVLEDWKVSSVKRPKDAKDCSEFTVTFKSKSGDGLKYQEGDLVTVKIVPVAEAPEEAITFCFKAVKKKKCIFFSETVFERITG